MCFLKILANSGSLHLSSLCQLLSVTYNVLFMYLFEKHREKKKNSPLFNPEMPLILRVGTGWNYELQTALGLPSE